MPSPAPSSYHHRRHPCLAGYNYHTPGYYFVQDEELEAIRRYILENPVRWELKRTEGK